MTLDNTWYTEQWAEQGSAISLKLKQRLHDEQSEYQRIEIFETETFGRLMTLDGLVMVTDRDNFVYHEMMTHPTLFTHPDPKRVLIIGGGDCGTLKEVLRHPGVALAEQVELDERVTRVAEQFFPALCASNKDPRARLHFADGIKWVADAEPDSYDVIIVDSTDPVRTGGWPVLGGVLPQLLIRALGAHGVVVGQSESPLFHADLIVAMHQALRAAGFADVGSLQFAQCTYPSGWWSATMARKSGKVADFREADARAKTFPTKYYNADLHRGALAMPEFLRAALAGAR